MTKPLTPPDSRQCQSEITTYNPWVMGGPTHTTKRCEKPPTTIIREKKPGADGQRGSMSLCDECLVQARKKLGANFFSERRIRPAARAGRTP